MASPTRTRTSLRRQLLFALTVVGALVVLTAAVSLASHEALHGQLDEVAQAEHEMAAALWLSLAARDVYAHQAHSVVLNDKSHIDHYIPSLIDAKNLAIALDAMLTHDEDRVLLGRVTTQLTALDDNFQHQLVPRLGGPREALVAPHDRALAITDGLGRDIDRLTNTIRARVDSAQASADAGRHREVLLLLLVLLVAFTTTVVVGSRLLKALGRPLGDLEEGARRFATGELDHRVPVRGDDELGRLATQMNAMAKDLADHGERLLAAERLASLGQIAAGIAHEVNNPLAAISGYAQVLDKTLAQASDLDPRARGDLGRIRLEADRCREIVTGLLDLSRPPRLALFPTDLVELVRDARAAVESAGQRCDLEVRAGTVAEVEVDPAKVRQILVNLLRNASEAGTRVSVDLEVDAASARVAVTDDGPGVDPALAATLFEPFRSAKASGTGLGLAVSRALARAHGGDLVLDPLLHPQQTGARFVLTLPRPVRP
jgi:two-component system NtrC family sensor kinase